MALEKLSDVAAKGDRLASLEVLRAHLAAAIDRTNDGAELSSLALRFQRVLAEIHELGGVAPEEGNDDLASKRAAKLRAASNA